jgi:hypothetical protein
MNLKNLKVGQSVVAYTEKDITSICTRYGVSCNNGIIDLDSIKGRTHQEQVKNIRNLSYDLKDAGHNNSVETSIIVLSVKNKWLDMEDFVAMIPTGRVMKTDHMNQLVDDYNKGKLSMDDLKKAIKESKKTSVDEFLKK